MSQSVEDELAGFDPTSAEVMAEPYAFFAEAHARPRPRDHHRLVPTRPTGTSDMTETSSAQTSAASALLIVFSSPTEDADEERFNRWYTEVHVPDILRLGGARWARRYRSSGVELLPGIPEPGQYVAVYQVEADGVDDVRAIAQKLQAGLAAGQADIDPTLDLSSVRAAWVLPVSDVITV